MTRDVRELLQEAAPEPTEHPDVGRLWRRGRRRRYRDRALMMCAFASIIVLGAVTVNGNLLSDRTTPEAALGTTGSGASDTPRHIFIEDLHKGRVFAIDPESGSANEMTAELSAGDSQYRIVRTQTGYVFRGAEDDHTATFFVDSDFENPRSLGESWVFAPVGRSDRIWLASLQHPTDDSRTLGSVREVTVDGTVITEKQLPQDRWVVLAGALENGLLFQEGDTLVLWDPESGNEQVFQDPFPVAVGTTRLAMCSFRCSALRIFDSDTGTNTDVHPPDGYSFEASYLGSFSDDETMVAVPVTRVADQTRWVALVNVEDQEVDVIPESHLDADYGSITWASAGTWLYFHGPNNSLMGYRVGEAKATTVATPQFEWFGIAAS